MQIQRDKSKYINNKIRLVGNYDMGKKVGIHKLYKTVDDKEPFEFQKYQNGKLVETQIKNDI